MLNLILNCGSSTIKYKIFRLENLQELAAGQVKKLSDLSKVALNYPIDVVSHRVVHGGAHFKQPTILSAGNLKKLAKLSELAPLHNPTNLLGIQAATKLFPKAKQIAVFDTSYYSTLPEKSFRYAIPDQLSKKYQIRRYGFHGISHQYLADEVARLLKSKNKKIITCHLGNGSSITAHKNSQSVETSMGFTPLEGLIMGTRCGSIDPSIPLFLQKKTGKSPQQIEDILIRSSGLLAYSGISSDMRDIYAASKKNNQRAIATITKLSYQIAQYIGAYSAALGGLDAICFSGTMGQNAWYLRQEVIAYLNFFGAKISQQKNKNHATIISTPSSKVHVFILPTNEELQIARETKKLLTS